MALRLFCSHVFCFSVLLVGLSTRIMAGEPADESRSIISKVPIGTKITYSYTVFGGKKGEKALRVAILPAGDYVLAGRTFNVNYTDIFCLGAPSFTVLPGSVTYIGDFEMLALEKMADGERRNAMRYSLDLESTREQFATAYPGLSAELESWQPTNGATFQCLGDEFVAYAVPAGGKP